MSHALSTRPAVPLPGEAPGRPRAVNTNSEPLIQAYLESCGIRCDAPQFVRLVSNCYHEAESADYDRIHLELDDAASAWAGCLAAVGPMLPPRISVLDVGAGTGFASSVVLAGLGGRIARLVCLDLSEAMLRQGKARVSAQFPAARFIVGEIGCLKSESAFDLIVTNSVLHHIADVAGFCTALDRLLRPGGVYIAGHEPSREFYEHQTLYRWTRAYRKWRTLRRFVSPQSYLRRLRRAAGTPSVESATNTALMARGVISSPLPHSVIRQLIDIHVPMASGDGPGWGLPGFSREVLASSLPAFASRYFSSYAHIKDARARMGPVWRAVDGQLARRHPTAGSNFLIAMQRMAGREAS